MNNDARNKKNTDLEELIERKKLLELEKSVLSDLAKQRDGIDPKQRE